MGAGDDDLRPVRERAAHQGAVAGEVQDLHSFGPGDGPVLPLPHGHEGPQPALAFPEGGHGDPEAALTALLGKDHLHRRAEGDLRLHRHQHVQQHRAGARRRVHVRPDGGDGGGEAVGARRDLQHLADGLSGGERLRQAGAHLGAVGLDQLQQRGAGGHHRAFVHAAGGDLSAERRAQNGLATIHVDRGDGRLHLLKGGGDAVERQARLVIALIGGVAAVAQFGLAAQGHAGELRFRGERGLLRRQLRHAGVEAGEVEDGDDVSGLDAVALLDADLGHQAAVLEGHGGLARRLDHAQMAGFDADPLHPLDGDHLHGDGRGGLHAVHRGARVQSAGHRRADAHGPGDQDQRQREARRAAREAAARPGVRGRNGGGRNGGGTFGHVSRPLAEVKVANLVRGANLHGKPASAKKAR